MRELLVPVNVEDARRISSSITAMINEKQKAQKEVGKKKKAKKATLKTAPSGDMDTTNYDGACDKWAGIVTPVVSPLLLQMCTMSLKTLCSILGAAVARHSMGHVL